MLRGLTRNKMYSLLYMNYEFVREYVFLYKVRESIVHSCVLFSLLNMFNIHFYNILEYIKCECFL